MGEKAEYYNKQGLRLFCAGQVQEALDFFTKAIETDPQFHDAYRNRGAIFLEMNRIVEGNADIRKAKDLRSGRYRGKVNGKYTGKKNGKTPRLNWKEIESIYDAVFPIDSRESRYDALRGDDGFNPGVFLNDAAGREGTWESFSGAAPETTNCPVILELVNGKRLEVERARLFAPTGNDISIIRHDGHVERVIPLDYIACIRKSESSAESDNSSDSSCHDEIIETVDGRIYHLAIHPEQRHEHVVFGYAPGEQGGMTCKYIPLVNIRRRRLDCYLGEILVRKGYLCHDILRQALDEHQQSRKTKLGRIIAWKAKVPHTDIEKELERSGREKARQGLRTGELLIASGLVDEGQVADALAYQERQQNTRLGQFLVEKGLVQEKEMCMALAEKFRLPFVDLSKRKVSRRILTLLSKKFILGNEILPLSFDNDVLTVAALHPDVACLRREIIRECKCRDVRFVLALPSHLRIIIDLLDKKIGYA